ncbi:RNA-directed DNA polymerase [Curtobacterium sp. MCBA15_004]|uniref:RNA-directed DNA polymerase n=1 Tax=Curtobacterium sp. MCBA15_004 TaxID=1898733 RepID=UPI0009F6A144|nr:RNA-directed DNA polymerase [Curtobacterium sp. MCBA15_004]WIA97184.1 RNA-directed DNA polymerase [Curtobacterium sp. MCBA15_004]
MVSERRWQKAVTRARLLEAWTKIESGGGSGRDGISPEQFAGVLKTEIRLINRRLRHFDYSFQPYVEVLKSKGAGKNPRVVSLPSVRDRIALRVKAVFLREVHPDASMRLPQDVVAALISQLEKDRWSHFVKLDVKEFYPSISHEFLRARLTQIFRNEKIVDLFISAVEAPTVARRAVRPRTSSTRGVPQGLAVSNGMAEAVMQLLDDHVAASPNVAGFRFVDDIVLLGESLAELRIVTGQIRQVAALADLEIHGDHNAEKSKSGSIADGFDFLGYSFEWPRISVRKGSISKLEGRIARSFTAYRYAVARNPKDESWQTICRNRLQWHLDLVISGFVLEGRRVGWLAYFSQIRNLKLLRRLDELVAQKAVRFGVGDMRFKSFVRVYRVVSSRRNDSSGYLPDFDVMPVEEMRIVLVDIFNQPGAVRLSEDDVRARFKRRIKKLSRELESDVPSYR